ncbi:uncharacterized protein LOC132702546 isoform X2 [Cylas formicarius]|uniref:uncharacterized protein LOC132702546 isoform X2 n=1 Tax=Cylas formicarius TaxID=197179 RepID=UPI0029584084|nr:uncharacterized protein LOC132702546 isoform X2 [Cylas formicarius]
MNTTQEQGNFSNDSNYVTQKYGHACVSVFQQWIIYVYLAFFSVGCFTNFVQSLLLIARGRNGLMSIILQISIADILLYFVGAIEILSSYHCTWRYSTHGCVAFKGAEILGNTLVPYLIVCLNFHVISLWNLHKFEARKNCKNPLTSGKEDDECLVAKDENNRTLTIDYRKRKNDVSVIFPLIFVWFICLSISVPYFLFSTTVNDGDKISCVVVENSYGTILHSLILLFSFVLPYALVFSSLVLLLFKLSKTSQKDIDNVVTKQFEEIRKLLIFCALFSIVYMFISLQSGSAFRWVICFYMIPHFRETILSKLYICRNKDGNA